MTPNMCMFCSACGLFGTLRSMLSNAPDGSFVPWRLSPDKTQCRLPTELLLAAGA